MISCCARLAPFDIAELRELMSYDEMELDTIGDRKTALFVIISDTDDTFNFVVAIMYSQLFNLLCDKADDVYNGRLPVHVRCLLDEFANIGQIPKFDKLIATIRSREISASIMPARTRPIRKEICLNKQDLNLIQHKMRQLGTHNFGAYARKIPFCQVSNFILQSAVQKNRVTTIA